MYKYFLFHPVQQSCPPPPKLQYGRDESPQFIDRRWRGEFISLHTHPTGTLSSDQGGLKSEGQKNNCPPFLSTAGGGGGGTVGDGGGLYTNLTKTPNFNTIINTLSEEKLMSISCTYSKKNWENILTLLQRARNSKSKSVEEYYGFRKREAQKDTNDIGKTGNSIRTIDLAINQIRHSIEKENESDNIMILLDINMYHLIERLRRRKLRL